MPLLGFFRRKPAIRAAEDLAVFIDQQAAYLIQRYIYDYTHARTGPFSKSLYNTPEFMQTVDASRWSAFPLGLAMVGEMVDGVLRPYAAEDDRRAVLDPLRMLVLEIFDRYPVPEVIGQPAWQEARTELARKLDQIGTHSPKSVSDIPVPYAERYFNMMPFDRKLLTDDVPTTRSYLRLTLINMRDELVKRMDAEAVVRALVDRFR